MSQYDDQIDSINVVCPYCKYEYQPEGEDYSEGLRVDECGECGMKFELCQSFDVAHHTYPDCSINNTEHDWQPIELRDGKTHDFCTICDKCRPFR